MAILTKNRAPTDWRVVRMDCAFLSDILGEGNNVNEPEQPIIIPDEQVATEVPPMSMRIATKRSKNFSKDEDKVLVSAWLNTSMDPIQGNEQAHGTYWERIHAYFHKHKTFVSDRNRSSLMHRWSDI